MNYRDAVAAGLVEELLEVVYRYTDTMAVATAVGCLEMVKAQVIEDQKPLEDDE